MQNYSTAVFLINDDVRAVRAIYEPDLPGVKPCKRETFKTFDADLKVGDYAIVPTETRHNMTVVRITEVDFEIDPDATEEVRWIIGRVGLADFEDLKRKEQDAIEAIKSAERRKKREDLKASLFADHAAKLAELELSSDRPAIEAPAAKP